MAPVRSINLIKTETSAPELGGVTPVLKQVGSIILIIFIMSGVLAAGAFVLVKSRQNQLATDQTTLSSRVNQDTVKEGLLLALRERASVITKISASQKNIGKFFAITNQFVPAANLSSISIDDTNKTIVVMRVATVAEAGAVTDALLRLGDENLVTAPTLLALTLTKDGGLEMSMSFVPTL